MNAERDDKIKWAVRACLKVVGNTNAPFTQMELRPLATVVDA